MNKGHYSWEKVQKQESHVLTRSSSLEEGRPGEGGSVWRADLCLSLLLGSVMLYSYKLFKTHTATPAFDCEKHIFSDHITSSLSCENQFGCL